MKTLILIVVLFSIQIFAQNPPAKFIEWTDTKACGEKNFTPAETEEIVCDSFVVNGGIVKTIFHSGLFVAVSFADNGDNLIADVYVANNTGNRILLDPQRWAIDHYKAESDFTSRSKSLGRGMAGSVSPDKLAKKIVRRVAWSNVFTNLAANYYQTSTATINNRAGAAIGTVTYPDSAAKSRAANENAERSDTASQQAQHIVNTALRQNTMFDKTYLTGLVYFPRHKKAKFSLVMVQIEKVLFFFKLRQ